MPLKIIRGNHWQIIGRGVVLLSCPPLSTTSKDDYTGAIVEETALLSKSHALIEKEPKQTEDPQFAENALSEFRSSTKELIDEFRIKLILAIVGREEPGMEVLTSQNDPERDPAVAFLRKKFAEFNLRVSKLQTSNEMQSIQIGLGPDERGFRREQVVSGIVDLIGQMNMVLGSVEGDEGAGGVLD